MQKILIICIGLCLSTNILYAQNKVIKGRVVDEHLEVLPAVSIFINDTIKVGRTDMNGFFQIDIPVSTEKMSFSFVGYEHAVIKLADKCNEVEIVMIAAGTHDFISLKRVDKLRLKTFSKLPKLHKEAFEKGLFKTDKDCYIREFIPYHEKSAKVR